jgi:acetyl esterase/lipase
MKPSSRFLLAGLAAAANTADAVRPAARQGPGAIPSFAFGVVPSEWPVQTGLVQLGTAALLARKGGLKGWRGALGVGAYAASIAGLAYMHRVALKAGPILEQALVDEFGADYRSRITEDLIPKPEIALARKQLLMPDTRVRRRYRAQRDISYGEFGRRNVLDVWKRADLPADGKAPVLFQVHGGAWTVGFKEGQAETLMSHLAERGWIVVTTNYRLSPKATWPDHIVDVKRALAWAKANIADHGGDPNFIAITGGSAGGHLAALTALTPNLAAFQPGFEDVDTTVNAAVPFYGIYDFLNRNNNSSRDMEKLMRDYVFKTRKRDDLATWDQASPISHVGPDAPPFFVLHGTNDSLVPIEQTRSFVDELRKESNNPVAYAELPGAQHAFEILPSVRAYAAAHAVERFLAVIRSS